MSNSLDLNQVQCLVSPDLGSNFLLNLSPDVESSLSGKDSKKDCIMIFTKNSLEQEK